MLHEFYDTYENKCMEYGMAFEIMKTQIRSQHSTLQKSRLFYVFLFTCFLLMAVKRRTSAFICHHRIFSTGPHQLRFSKSTFVRSPTSPVQKFLIVPCSFHFVIQINSYERFKIAYIGSVWAVLAVMQGTLVALRRLPCARGRVY